MVSAKWRALALALTLAGCQAVPAPVSNPRQVWCDHNAPWIVSLETAAVMSRIEKEALVTHNRQGAEWCGWGRNELP